MVRVPIKSRTPIEGWVVAAAFTVVSIVSSAFGGPDASDVLQLSPLFDGAGPSEQVTLAHSAK